MEVARATLRSFRHLTLPLATNALLLRPAASPAIFRACFSSSTLRPAPRRKIPDDCKNFMFTDGNLCTNEANAAFLAKYDITHDHAVLDPLWVSQNASKAIFRRFEVQILYTPQHVMALQDLEFLDPRGHPLAAKMRDRYVHMANNEPLWLRMKTTGGAAAVVRMTVRKRILSSIYAALEAKGYDRYGNGRYRNIEGTATVIVYNPVKTVSLPKEDFAKFGGAFVAELEAQQRLRERGYRSENVHKTSTQRRGSSPRAPNFQRSGNAQRTGSPSPFLRSHREPKP